MDPMTTKGTKKSVTPQSASSSKRGKMLGPDPGNAMGPAGQYVAKGGKEVTQGPGEKLPPATTKSHPKAKGHVPNDETAQVLREIEEGKNLIHYDSFEDMYEDLGI